MKTELNSLVLNPYLRHIFHILLLTFLVSDKNVNETWLLRTVQIVWRRRKNRVQGVTYNCCPVEPDLIEKEQMQFHTIAV